MKSKTQIENYLDILRFVSFFNLSVVKVLLFRTKCDTKDKSAFLPNKVEKILHLGRFAQS